MIRDVLRRLTALECVWGRDAIPTFETWLERWSELSDLDKALCIVEVENDAEATTEADRRRVSVLADYLHRVGALDKNAPTLREIAAEMDAANA